MTLLDKAMARPTSSQRRLDPNGEVVELALAWARNEIKLAQVRTALDCGKNSASKAYCTLARGLREAIRKGVV